MDKISCKTLRAWLRSVLEALFSRPCGPPVHFKPRTIDNNMDVALNHATLTGKVGL